jgi:hypothetical protein
MIVQDFGLPDYDWRIRVYYAVTTYWTDVIVNDLMRVGCGGCELRDAYMSLRRGELDTGLTYSNRITHESIMVIGLTSSAAQFQNSLDHEKGHLIKHISVAFGLDPYGEEQQYLSGEIGQRMFPVARKFLCEHCRRKLYEERY